MEDSALRYCDPSWSSSGLVRFDQCSLYSSAVTVGYLVASVVGVVLYRKLQPESFQKYFFWTAIYASLMRTLRYGLLSVFTNTNLPESIFTVLYVLPIAFCFSGLSLLFKNWSETYSFFTLNQKGKTVFETSLAMSNFHQISAMANVAMYTSILLLIALPQALLLTGFILFASGLALLVFGYQKYQQIRLLKGASPRLRQLAQVIGNVIASLSVNLLAFAVLLIGPDVGFLATQYTLRVLECSHLFAVFYMLAQRNTVSLPMPISPKHLTTQWLTEVLQETGTISENTEVSNFEGQTLRGGCHFKVSKVSLSYANETKSSGPKNLVVKILFWEKPLYEKVFLSIKKLFGSLDREVMYLDSYEIESRFYTHFARDIEGVKIPFLYYNLEDSVNNKFGMILQDLSLCENGQPYGFSLEDSKLCLLKLARFHASHWKKTTVGTNLKMWDIGGYWTGTKREGNKKDIKDAWSRVLKNFPEQVGSSSYTKELGKLLYEKLDKIADLFNAMEPKTLVHGDYKVSNIFIDKSKPEDQQVYAIDWQWFGVGNPALDVMYFLSTSIHHDHVGLQTDLVKLYHAALVSNGIEDYPFAVFWNQFKLCWLDFFIYVVVSKWGSMTPQDFAKYQNKRKDGLHLRSFAHMKKLIESAEEFLVQLVDQ